MADDEPYPWAAKAPPMKPAASERDPLIDHLAALTTALHQQTAAMRELAESNRAVVDLVIAQQGQAEEDEGLDLRTYLDGEPLEG